MNRARAIADRLSSARSESKRCDILFVTDRRFWRRSIGSEQRIANLIEHLAARGQGITVAYVGRPDREDRRRLRRLQESTPGIEVEARRADPRTLWPARRRSVRRDFVDSVASNRAPRIVIVEFLRLTYTIASLSTRPDRPRLWIDTHDVLHRRSESYRQAGSRLDREIDVDEEVLALETYDSILAIQDQEARVFRALLPRKDVIVVPHGLPIPKCPPPPARADDGYRVQRIGFLGGRDVANRRALDWFVSEVWPGIRARFGGRVELHVAGQVCREWAKTVEGIIPIGPVESIDRFWPTVDIAINPVAFGSGLKIKNVEALAYARPLLTTPTGAEGLETAAPHGMAIASDAHEWIETLRAWLSDPTAARELGLDGRRHAEARLAPDIAFRELERRIDSTLGEHGG